MQLYLAGHSGTNTVDREAVLCALCESWGGFSSRFNIPESDWVSELSGHLEAITEMRATYVQKWITQNLERFKASHASLETLRRACDTALIELKENVHLCKAQCSSCNLLCLQSYGHGSWHDCQTSHHCPHLCGFGDEHPSEEKKCGFRHIIPHPLFCPLLTPFQCWAFRTTYVCPGILCVRPIHSHIHFLGVLLIFTCAESPASSWARKGAWVNVPRFECPHIYYGLLTTPFQLSSHVDDKHLCPAQDHACGEVMYSKLMGTGSKPPPAL